MIISKNLDILFLGVPKTGTRTMENILTPLGIPIKEHKNYLETIEAAKNSIENFEESKIEKVYLFWRDPVERFIASVNQIKNPKFVQFAICYKPEWFSGIRLPKKCDNLPTMREVPPFPDDLFYGRINKGVFGACIEMLSSITPEQIFNDTELMESSVFFIKQSFWHQYIPSGKKFVLDFSGFEENAKKVAVDFRVIADIEVPKLNVSTKTITELSPELEAAVRNHYAEDYNLKPHQ